MPARPAKKAATNPPAGFRVRRDLPLGRHPLLAAFPGLDRLASAERLEPDPVQRGKLLDETCVMLVADDLWMYVAPWRAPSGARRWRPVVSPGSDCIVIGQGHLRESPEFMLFLDIFHELCHVRQRRDGAELFGGRLSYVERPTEIEAYRFAVEEARRLGADDTYLREYLHVDWINDRELAQLCRSVGVNARK